MNKKLIFRLGTLIVLIFLTIFFFYLWRKESGEHVLTVAFLDIGQGDAIFIEAPNGNQVLIDGGPGKSILRELGAVMSFSDRSIDVVLATHPDADHIGGLPDVFLNYEVSLFMEPGVDAETELYKEVKGKMERSKNGKIKEILARRGMRVDLGGGVALEILYPTGDVSNWETNDASIVVRLVYGETEFMFTGDAPMKTERALMYLDPSFENMNSDVLKVGHHGSKTSTSPEFVSAVSPEYAVISVGSENRYGHPTAQVLETLQKEKIKILRTDTEGRVVFKSDGEKINLISN